MPPPVELRKRPQDGISLVQNVAVVQIGFRCAPRCFRGIWINIGGRSRPVELRGAHEGGGAPTPWARPPPSWAPRCSTDVLLPPIYTYVPPNDQIRSQKPNSTAATFCTHGIPSWGLFRSSAGGGLDHGGLLHQHHSLSDDV